MVEDYLYHTINKDIDDEKQLYDSLDKILKCGNLFSNSKRNEKSDDALYNGDNYICLLKYVPISEYKVYKMNKNEFDRSKFKDMYNSYQKYLDDLKKSEFKEKPLSKNEFMKENNTDNVRDYYDYLDSISNLYPVDLKVLYDKTKCEVYDMIINIMHKDYGYFNANENAFYKFVVNSTGITLMFDKKIRYRKTILIPNLPFSVENQVVLKLSKLEDRYSNLIGELQKKDFVSLKYLRGILINGEISKDKVIDIMKCNNIDVPVYKLENDKLVEI